MDEQLFWLIPVTGDDDGSGSSVEEPTVDENSQPGDNSSVTEGDKGTSGKKPDTDWEAKYAELQKNVSRLQSTYDKKLADKDTDTARQLAEMQKQFDEFRMRGMDEEERAKFMREKSQQEHTTVMTENAQLKSRIQEQQMIGNWREFATSELKLDPTTLVLDKGVEAMSNSMWEAVRAELSRLRGIETTYLKGQAKKKDGTTDEAPVKNLDGSAAKGTTLKDLIKVYGSEEGVYDAFEAGLIKEVPV